jgi:hypothetical protein
MKPKFLNYAIWITVSMAVMTSCGASSKVVLSSNVDINQYKYVVLGNSSTGNNALNDVVLAVQNMIANTNLTVLQASTYSDVIAYSGHVLTPIINIKSETYGGGHTYITVTFYDFFTDQCLAVVKSSGIGMTIEHDQQLALRAIEKKLNTIFN